MMNPASLGFEFAASSAAAATSAAAAAAASQSTATDSGTDHLQRLAAMTQSYLQGVGKDDSESSTPSSADAALYPGAYMPGYGAWPNYYPQFGQPLAPAAAAFGTWPAQCYPAAHWPNYAQTKKGRQTYQRYQTSVLESKFQQSSYVSKKQREELRLQTNLTDRQIKIWFQNRRMKAKKEKHRMDEHGEHAAPLLPANPPKGACSNGGVGGAPPPDPLLNSHHTDEEKKWAQQCMQNAAWGQMGPATGYHPQYPICPQNI